LPGCAGSARSGSATGLREGHEHRRGAASETRARTYRVWQRRQSPLRIRPGRAPDLECNARIKVSATCGAWSSAS
jgi:hypothetical protein